MRQHASVGSRSRHGGARVAHSRPSSVGTHASSCSLVAKFSSGSPGFAYLVCTQSEGNLVIVMAEKRQQRQALHQKIVKATYAPFVVSHARTWSQCEQEFPQEIPPRRHRLPTCIACPAFLPSELPPSLPMDPCLKWSPQRQAPPHPEMEGCITQGLKQSKGLI